MNLNHINCKEIFQDAYEKRYTWNDEFSGYGGKCKLYIDDKRYEGNFILGKDLKPQIKNIENNDIVKSISSQLFEVSIHRVKRDFQSIHSNNIFNLIKNSHKGIEMQVSGKNDGDRYRVKDKSINMVYRKIHGVIIEIFVQEFLDTGFGVLSKKYTSQQIDPTTHKANSPILEYEDNFEKIDKKNIWLLNSRKIECLNESHEKKSQKFIFEDLFLLS